MGRASSPWPSSTCQALSPGRKKPKNGPDVSDLSTITSYALPLSNSSRPLQTLVLNMSGPGVVPFRQDKPRPYLPRTFAINQAGDMMAFGPQTPPNIAMVARDTATGRLGPLMGPDPGGLTGHGQPRGWTGRRDLERMIHDRKKVGSKVPQDETALQLAASLIQRIG